MIDLELLRREPEGLAAALARRHLQVDVTELAALDRRRREARARAEEQRAAQKRSGKEIAGLSGEAKETAIAAAARLAEEYRESLAEADALDAAFDRVWRTLPNPPHAGVPDGAGEEDNVEIKRWGEIPQFSFEPRDHLDLGEALGIIDTTRGVKVSGARFAYLRGPAALLEIALIHFAMERLGAAGFQPAITPVMVRAEALYGTGFFPGAREQVYAVGWSAGEEGPVEADGLYLVGTAEVPLAAQHADEILDAGDLPLRYAGFSTCFRREAGTYGKDTRGIFRVHQFDKVEMFCFCPPERSWQEHEFLLSREEDLVQALGLPYRVVNVCTGDLGDSAAKKYDIEAWLPGQGAFREITSCSNTTDFQARRLRIRYRDDSGATRLVHTLNGTAIAVGRTLIAILENYQQADGSVVVPEVLRPWLGLERIGP
ncbi:MAG: serine--tRNA ligase [Acidimicrobiia bacterium]|nr:serine--tRNA ligase [Acidimicrobiia bacterium]